MKPYMVKRELKRQEHAKILLTLPDRTHRIEGWAELIKYTGFGVEAIRRLMKLEEFPMPQFYYRPKSDCSNHRVNVWRRSAMWDKRAIGDWFAKAGRKG